MATSRKAKGIKVQTANVQLHRNGLTLEMQGVPADEVEFVAAHMLSVVRSMIKQGYVELVAEGTPLHAAPLGEVRDDEGMDESKRMGFHSRG